MPIYAYRCSSCGFTQDVLQKMSDPLLSVCPNCGQPALVKQVTAAGFQLKGSGWYVTDFREGKKSGDGEAKSDAKPGEVANTGDKAAASTSEATPAASGAAAAPAPAPAPAASPAPAPAASPPATGGKPG